MARLSIASDSFTEDEVQALVDWLRIDPDVSGLDKPDVTRNRIEPVSTAIAVSTIAIVGTGIVTRVLDWMRSRSDCLLVVDARGDDVKIESRCDLDGYRGKTIVITDADTQVTLDREKGAIDAEMILAAARAGARDLKELVATDKNAELSAPSKELGA